MTNYSTTRTTTAFDGVRAIALALFVAGAALVYTVGFSHSMTLHNAAHDSRHALAFPCH
ncbi:MAG: CbtB-domain containing protein [Rhizobiales bacterium]|nr:CbtB-domain containing protein [Hyphomicrobiales bacterium]